METVGEADTTQDDEDYHGQYLCSKVKGQMRSQVQIVIPQVQLDVPLNLFLS